MPQATRANMGAAFEPETLKVLCQVLDEVWASVSADYGTGAQDIEAARLRLATIILDLGRDGQFDALQIAQTAGRIMREKAAQQAR